MSVKEQLRTVTPLVENAKLLLDGGAHPEYERAIVEMVIYEAGLSNEDFNAVLFHLKEKP